jgi:hypothetical protein
MYNQYTHGIIAESVGMHFEGEMSELDFFQNIRKGINYFMRVDEQGMPTLVCSHRVVQIGSQNIILGDYFWIRPDSRGNAPFMQESMEMIKEYASSSFVISSALPEYLETFKFVFGATELPGGVHLV